MNILLIIYNRPDLTAQVFETIRVARPERLFIVADGANPTKITDPLNCRMARLSTENIDWPCEVKRLYRSTNSGCKHGVSTAITWFFEHVEEGIILEDDCVPSQSFFSFCKHHLEVHKNDPQIGHISGTNFFENNSTSNSYNYSITNSTNIWGWASWSRVWKHYSLDPIGDKKFRFNAIDGNFNHKIYWYRKLIELHHNKIDTWDYQYQYMLWHQNLKSVYPSKNLIQNIGFDYRATHTKTSIKALETNGTNDIEIVPSVRASASLEHTLNQQIIGLTQRNFLVNITKLCTTLLANKPFSTLSLSLS